MSGEAGMQLNQSTIVWAGSAWFSVEAYETTEVTGKPVGYRWGYLHYIASLLAYGNMVELADTLDLESSTKVWEFESLYSYLS